MTSSRRCWKRRQHLRSLLLFLLRLSSNCSGDGGSSAGSGGARFRRDWEPLARCSDQPASLCGRAAHASAEPLNSRGAGSSLGFSYKALTQERSPRLRPAASLSAPASAPQRGSPLSSIPAWAEWRVVARLQTSSFDRTERRLMTNSSSSQTRLRCCAPARRQRDCFSWDCCTVCK